MCVNVCQCVSMCVNVCQCVSMCLLSRLCCHLRAGGGRPAVPPAGGGRGRPGHLLDVGQAETRRPLRLLLSDTAHRADRAQAHHHQHGVGKHQTPCAR